MSPSISKQINSLLTLEAVYKAISFCERKEDNLKIYCDGKIKGATNGESNFIRYREVFIVHYASNE